MVEIVAGLSALKTALDLAKGLKEIDDAAKRNAAVIDLQQTILDAQQAQLHLNNKVAALEAELIELKSKRDKLARYEMINVRGSGTFAYRLKPDKADGQPPHVVCLACYESEKISTLQATGSMNGQDFYECYACKRQYGFGRVDGRPYSSEVLG